MILDQSTIVELASMYLRAERDAAPVPPWRERFPGVTEDDAYAIQNELLRLHLANGATLAGWKAGATNPGAQATFELRDAVYGRLLSERRLSSGVTLPMAALIHPRVECEVAFVLARDLSGPGVTPEAALAAVQGMVAAFEIVDSRTTGWAAKMPELIADNVFQARYVLSERVVPVTDVDLAALEVVLFRNGQEAARARGASVLGSPANALAWMANRIAAHGHALRAGQVVLAGSLTPLVPCAPGDTFEAVFDHLGPIRVTCG
ncbi:MAG: fumarylacetoacetate hydrolase family protein [Oscillochloridaceae bacterium]|nr:fumarylacetoacetate hydrolase family protein [Chloroflexaceae bacterium]MDW8390228.1 fumarylacetoacetate hydrolase family protein [Oscillochloridaceae bacterium]